MKWFRKLMHEPTMNERASAALFDDRFPDGLAGTPMPLDTHTKAALDVMSRDIAALPLRTLSVREFSPSSVLTVPATIDDAIAYEFQHDPTPKGITMPDTFGTVTATPSEHQAALEDGRVKLRETEKALILQIKDNMATLANVQHAIRSYDALNIALAQPVAKASLDPVPEPTPQLDLTHSNPAPAAPLVPPAPATPPTET